MNGTNGKKIDLDTCERRRLAFVAATDMIRGGHSAAEAFAIVWNDSHVRETVTQWERDWRESR